MHGSLGPGAADVRSCGTGQRWCGIRAASGVPGWDGGEEEQGSAGR